MSRLMTRLAVALVVAASPAALPAATYLVQSDGTGDYPTIQAAIDASAAGDTVALADGTFTGAGNKNLDFHGKAIVVQSASGDAETCVIDCELSGRGFVFHSGEDADSRVEGLTVVRGRAFSGGAVHCDGESSPTFSGCVFRENATVGSDGVNGGAVYCSHSSSSFTRCTFERNETIDYWGGGYGGGIYGLSCTLLVVDCPFIDNVAGWGGGAGIACQLGSVMIANCVFQGNDVAGILCDRAELVISNCHFVNNHNAVTVYDTPSVQLLDCRFAGNRATRYGGALSAWGASPLLSRCTFVSDSAGMGGSAVNCGENASATILSCTFYALRGSVIRAALNSFPTIENTIIAQSESGAAVSCEDTSVPTLSCCDLYGNAGGDWVGCIADQFGGNGNFSADPLFCDPPHDNLTLAAASPCAPENSPGDCGLIGAWPVGCDAPMGAGERPPRAAAVRLGLIEPVPTTGCARIACLVPSDRQPARVALHLLDSAGRRVRTIELNRPRAGVHWVEWDGRDDEGIALPSGTYFCRLGGGGVGSSGRLILIR